jgi:alanyl-tRNA synthetase
MTSGELIELYTRFFERKGHVLIPGASLLPENDSTILFTPAGMQPLVPFLLGEIHPAGMRLVNLQKCVRTGDIDNVGDPTHLTFFEMLGNWSLGDYWKREAIEWSFEFLTGREWLGFDPDLLYVTVFEGCEQVPPDDEAALLWEETGIPRERILFLGMEDNWWGPTGLTGPCGPDTEMFIDTGSDFCSSSCRPGCSCGKYFEVWNDVFMQYRKTGEGRYLPLEQRNVDTGMGVERTVAMLSGKKSVFDIREFEGVFGVLRKLAGIGVRPDPDTLRSMRIIADHVRTSVHILGDDMGVLPSNLDQGYVLRRLIRLAVRHCRKLGISSRFTVDLAGTVIDSEEDGFPELARNRERVLEEMGREEELFERTLQSGFREFEKILPDLLADSSGMVPGRVVFRLYDTYGFPPEFTRELAAEHGMSVDMDGYGKAFEKHRELSRKGAGKKFSGGLADHSTMVTRLHTATHLLQAALRHVLGDHVAQKGSNITPERLRFDFNHADSMTPGELEQVEKWVNDVIEEDIPVEWNELTPEEARGNGAIGLFTDRYGDRVKVYTIPDYSCEVCGGPHVERTGLLGRFRIVSEKSSSRGIRRIKAVLE